MPETKFARLAVRKLHHNVLIGHKRELWQHVRLDAVTDEIWHIQFTFDTCGT